METNRIGLEQGRIKYYTYYPEDVWVMPHVRPVIYDIYSNISEMNKNIVWILNATPADGYQMKDLLDKFVSSMSSMGIIMTCAGTLSNSLIVDTNNKILDGIQAISTERQWLFNSNFANVLFKRRMSRCYGNSNIFIYMNTDAEDFLKKYEGEYIDRYVTSD